MRVLAIDTATTDLVTGVVDTETGAVTERILTDTRARTTSSSSPRLRSCCRPRR